MKKPILFLLVVVLWIGNTTNPLAQDGLQWSMDVGVRGFKYFAEGGPNEIKYNPVIINLVSINLEASWI